MSPEPCHHQLDSLFKLSKTSPHSATVCFPASICLLMPMPPTCCHCWPVLISAVVEWLCCILACLLCPSSLRRLCQKHVCLCTTSAFAAPTRGEKKEPFLILSCLVTLTPETFLLDPHGPSKGILLHANDITMSLTMRETANPTALTSLHFPSLLQH